LIDATAIGSAAKRDKEAAWVRHRTRAPAHGFKAHIAADKDTGIIREVETMPANEPDVAIAPSIVPEEPGEVYADKAYDALAVEKAIEAEGGTSRLMRKGHRWLPAERLEAHNRPLRPIRSRIEKIFRTWKRSRHFRCMRWLGLAKAKLQPRSPTTSNAIGGCEPPERIRKKWSGKPGLSARPTTASPSRRSTDDSPTIFKP
jgi:transposase, IS5 family